MPSSGAMIPVMVKSPCAGLTTHWAYVAAPSALGRAGDYVATVGDREAWQGEVRFDGRLIACRFAPLAGGSTLAGHVPHAGPGKPRPPKPPPPTNAARRLTTALAVAACWLDPHHEYGHQSFTISGGCRAAPTRAAAVCVTRLCAGDTALLSGPVGAAKSHFARALIRARLGRMEDALAQLLTLVQVYDADVEIWHADLYRLEPIRL